MVIIAPSVLSCDFSKFGEEIATTGKTSAEYIHIDVMDGMFVPNLTFGPPIIKAIRPFSDKVFDVHLMINEPIRYIKSFKDAGADIITVHLEACSDVEKTLLAIRESGAKVGISIKPKTDPSLLERYLPLLDMILIMTVEPGFGGQTFIYEAVRNITAVKEILVRENINIPIEVDGGITVDTIGVAAAAGAEIFVAGSAVYGKPDIALAVEKLRVAAEKAV